MGPLLHDPDASKPAHGDSEHGRLRRWFAGVIGAGAVTAAAATGFAAIGLGGGSPTAVPACLCVALGSLAAIAPAGLALGEKMRSFGMIVLASSMGRTLLMLSLGLFFDRTRTLDREAFWVSLLLGGAVMLVAETMAAVRVLSRLDRSFNAPGASPAAVSRSV